MTKLAVLLALLLAGCATYRPGPPLTDTERASYATSDWSARVRTGMTNKQVTDAVGGPTSYQLSATGRSWIPYASYGGGTNQAVWRYRGRGRILFSNPPGMFRSPVVIAVEPDPNERG